MKLRTARKIWAAAGTGDEVRYTADQLERAYRRRERTRTMRELRAFGHALRSLMTPAARADYARQRGRPGEALRILLETPEAEWQGDGGATWRAWWQEQRASEKGNKCNRLTR